MTQKWIEYDSPEKVKKNLEKIIRENPEDADAHYKLGTVYEYVQDLDKARKYAEKAVKLERQNILFWAFFAYICACTEGNQPAVDALTTLVELDADPYDYYVEEAIVSVCNANDELVRHQIEKLKKSGKETVAEGLKKWLIYSRVG